MGNVMRTRKDVLIESGAKGESSRENKKGLRLIRSEPPLWTNITNDLIAR